MANGRAYAKWARKETLTANRELWYYFFIYLVPAKLSTQFLKHDSNPESEYLSDYGKPAYILLHIIKNLYKHNQLTIEIKAFIELFDNVNK